MVLAHDESPSSVRDVDVDVATLAVAAARGDYAAFASLYERYARPIYNMILRSVRDRQLSEDVAQEVWTKAYRDLRSLREPRCFPAWLYRIAAKKCIDAARRRARRPETAPLTDDVSAVFGDPEGSLLAREDATRMWDALAGLSTKQHMALYLREVERRSYGEIAFVLHISETAAGLCVFRARKSLAVAYDNLQRAPRDACASTHRAMSLSLDGHATPVQRRALELHIDRCSPCRNDFASICAVAQGYGALALVPAPFVLHQHALGAVTAQSTVGGVLSKIAAWIAPNVKAAAVAGGVAATAGVSTIAAAAYASDFVHVATGGNAVEQRPAVDALGAGTADVPGGGDTSATDAHSPSYGGGSAPGDDAVVAVPGGLLIPPTTVLPGAEVAAPSTDQLLDDVTATVDEVDEALTIVVDTLDETLTTVDDAVDGALTTVDQALTDTDEAIGDTLDGVDEALDVGETLDGGDIPIVGPPLAATTSSPTAAPTPGDEDLLDPATDLLPLP